MKHAIFFVLVYLGFACGGSDDPDPAAQMPFTFEDGFEVAGEELADLLPADGSRWTNVQQVNPQGAQNEIEITTVPTSEDDKSLRILARASNLVLSKMDIEKGGFQAYAGAVVTIQADFYISTTESLSDLLLIDLECCSCWDPNVPDNNARVYACKCPMTAIIYPLNGVRSPKLHWHKGITVFPEISG